MEFEHQEVQPTSGARPLRRLVDRIANRLFAAEDDRARARGWQVRPISGGLGRGYRDPRWDMIRACDNCADFGADPDCPVCGGTEVIRLDPDLDPADDPDLDPDLDPDPADDPGDDTGNDLDPEPPADPWPTPTGTEAA